MCGASMIPRRERVELIALAEGLDKGWVKVPVPRRRNEHVVPVFHYCIVKGSIVARTDVVHLDTEWTGESGDDTSNQVNKILLTQN